MMKAGGFGLVTTCLAVVYLCACQAPTTPADKVVSSHALASHDDSAHALLDWDTASITLPIDRFGMTPHEQQVMDAAGSIAFARCVQGSDIDEPRVIAEAARYLSTKPFVMNGWLYGVWDASYLARFGWPVNGDPPLTMVATDPVTADRCWGQVVDEGLMAIMAGSSMDNQASVLATGYGLTYDQTMADLSFKSLQSQWRACVHEAGYVLDESYDTAAARVDPAWAPEQLLEAKLTEATCADQMGYTQRVGNINASFQVQFISAHEAELVSLRQTCDDRLSKAALLLHSVGVL